MDNCDRCNAKRELYWNDTFGGSLCERCDGIVERGGPLKEDRGWGSPGLRMNEVRGNFNLRTDIHKPSLLDPAEYEFMAAFYQGGSEDMMKSYQYDMQEYDEALERYSVFQGNHDSKGTCDHCGAAFAHGALFLHIPTQELIHVGHICASNTVGLPDKAAAARKKAEKYAAKQAAHRKQMEKTEGWRNENAVLLEWMENQENPHGFIISLLSTVHKWGDLSQAQTRAAYKWMEGAAKREAKAAEAAERLSNAMPVRDGRYDILGTILSKKWKNTQFGDQLKMVVELPDGNRIYGTVPKALRAAGVEIGSEIKFTATVEKSKNDEHFGFFAKPTNAEVI